jgi:hypothetical protein
MRLQDSNPQAALEAWRRETGEARAEADNIWFEERVSAARQQAFEDAAAGASAADSLRRRHIDYWETWVKVSEDIPHTFLAHLEPADLGSHLAGLAHWAMARNPADAEFTAEWRALKPLYPRTAARWRI